MVSHTVASCFCFYGPERYKIKSDSLKISRTLGLKWDCTYNRRHAVKIYIFILHYISIHWKCIHEILTYFEKNLKYSKMLQSWMTICNLLSPNMGFAKDCSDGHNNFIIILVHPSSARPTAQRLVLNIILHKSRRTRRLLTFSESQNFLLRAHNVAIWLLALSQRWMPSKFRSPPKNVSMRSSSVLKIEQRDCRIWLCLHGTISHFWYLSGLLGACPNFCFPVPKGFTVAHVTVVVRHDIHNSRFRTTIQNIGRALHPILLHSVKALCRRPQQLMEVCG